MIIRAKLLRYLGISWGRKEDALEKSLGEVLKFIL